MIYNFLRFTLLSFFFLANIDISLSEDFSQSLGGDQTLDEFESDVNSNEDINAHLEGSASMNEFEKDLHETSMKKAKPIKKDPYIEGGAIKNFVDSKNPNEFTGATLDGHFDSQENYLEYRNKDLVFIQSNKAKNSYTFTYFRDSYEYKSQGDVFNRTFDKSEEGHKVGTLHLEYRKYISKGLVNTHWGLAFGIGHNYGKGLFVDNSELSRTTFKVWSFPIDLLFGVEAKISSLIKVSLSGGPSVLPVTQSRSDKDSKEKGKRINQIGSGYTGTGSLQFNLSHISSDVGFNMLSQYSISNFYLNASARYQSYDNFKDQITVEGLSLGIGFSFEYL